MEQLTRLLKVETRDSKWLYDNLQQGFITSDSSFQRRYVWLEKHKIRLIETILIGYPIPEIYLWTRDIRPNGETHYSVIDGQQRLNALQSFINNVFRLDEADLEYAEASYANKNFDELSKEHKLAIWKYMFSLRFVDVDVQEEQIRKMFLRLNSANMTLNPQELRNAKFEGKFLELSGEIAGWNFWADNKIFNANQIRRMQDVEFVSTILLFFRDGIDDEVNQSKLDEIYEQYNKEYEEYEEDKTLFETLLYYCTKIIEYNKKIVVFLNPTQLYTLLVTLYYFHTKYGGITEEHIKNYHTFVEAYKTDINNTTLQTYKQNSASGARKKQNRFTRVDTLKKVMEKGYEKLVESI